MKIEKQIAEQKNLIAILEAHRADNEKLMDDYAKLNNGIIVIEDPKVKLFQSMIYQMLKYENFDLAFKLGKMKKQLREMVEYFETTYKHEFEKKSRICNLNIDYLITKAKKQIEKYEQSTISANIKNTIIKYELERETISQEDKNDIYDSLESMLNFLKKEIHV